MYIGRQVWTVCQCMTIFSRCVRLAKNDWFGFAKNCGFRFSFGFAKLTTVSFFRFSFLHCVLFNVYDILLCWIGPTNCQPKWLRTRSAEISIKKNTLTVDPILLEDELWMRQRENRPQTAEVDFLKPNCGNWVFGFWILRSVRFGFYATAYML